MGEEEAVFWIETSNGGLWVGQEEADVHVDIDCLWWDPLDACAGYGAAQPRYMVQRIAGV